MMVIAFTYCAGISLIYYCRGSSVLSFGIVKEAYLITVQQVAITHVVPHVQYLGEYPMYVWCNMI